jgi:hypothetical protein
MRRKALVFAGNVGRACSMLFAAMIKALQKPEPVYNDHGRIAAS